MKDQDHSKEYSEESLWAKIKEFGRAVASRRSCEMCDGPGNDWLWPFRKILTDEAFS
jgi:hypothetical protein